MPAGARVAYDAVNAKMVDGRSAVGFGASVTTRKGKLVATNGKTGRLPNNIIATAPNAAKLDGYSHAAFRYLPIDTLGAYLNGNALVGYTGPALSSNGTGGFTVSFTMPPDYKAGSPITMDVMFYNGYNTACKINLTLTGLQGSPGGDPGNGSWQVNPGGPYTDDLAISAARLSVRHFKWNYTDKPSDLQQFTLQRNGDAASDNCSTLYVPAMQLRY